METKAADKKGAQGANNNEVKTNIRPNLTGKEAKDDTAKNQTPAPTVPVKAEPQAEVKTSSSPAQDNQLANTAQPVEPTKKELKAELQETKARGLDDTVKLVEQLGKKIAQKNKLFNTVSNLDAFVVTQSDDKDDVSADSKFPRCELVISDDGGEEFVTKNPFIIARVVDMVKQLCIEKLAEVEATIIIP